MLSGTREQLLLVAGTELNAAPFGHRKLEVE